MFSRREYESYFGKVTDEEWKNVLKSIDNAMDKLYDEDHPMDE